MLMTRWNPFGMEWWSRPLGETNRLSDRAAWPALAVSYPPVNLWEDEANLYVEAELPGMALDKLELYVNQGDQLTIEGERVPFEAAKGVWHRQERGFGKFSRAITLPCVVDADKV